MNRIVWELRAAGGELKPVVQNEAVSTYRFPQSFSGFSGHFPGDPILPAIIQLMIASDLAGRMRGQHLRLSTIHSAKFLAPVRPDTAILVRCRLSADNDSLLGDATLSVDGSNVAVFQIGLSEGGEL